MLQGLPGTITSLPSPASGRQMVALQFSALAVTWLLFFFLFCFGFFCTVNLTLLKQNVMCPLSLVHYLIKGGKRRPLKDKRNNSTLCINNRVRFDCDGFPERLSRFLFLNCTRPSAAARLHLNTALKPAGDTVTDCTLLSQPAARGR